MNKVLYIILISLFSFTIFSCAKKDSTSSTTSSPLYVAVGDNGTGSGTILTSPDGTTWTERTYGTFENLHGVTYGNGLFVTVGNLGIIYTSSDGTSWTTRTTGTSNHLVGVTYSQ